MNGKLIIAFALGLAAPASAANLLVNGSFEQPGGAIVHDTLTTNYLPGWTYISRGGVDIYVDDSQEGLTAVDGSHYISFGNNYTALGSISQTFSTLGGTHFRLSLYTAQTQGSNIFARFSVLLATSNGGYFGQNINGLGNAFGLTEIDFYPVGAATTTLTIQDTSADNGVLALDKVSVVNLDPVVTGGVPEPASWAMLLAGFGITGLAMRRRRHLPTDLARLNHSVS